MKPLGPDDYLRARRERLADDGWIPSRFRGRCVVCGERFTEGTMLRREPDGYGWRAECCEATADDDQET